jgi:hypothetical protein
VAYEPLRDPSAWFAISAGAAAASAFAYFAPRAAYDRRLYPLQRWFFVPFLLIAVVGALVVLGFAIARLLGM